MSDQNIYMHKCDSCNHWQQLDFERNIVCIDKNGVDEASKTVQDGSYRYVCSNCGKGLDRWYNGQWVAQYPSRTLNEQGTRGYLISQLNAVWLSADAIMRKYWEARSTQHFYNYTLGMPYQDVAVAVQDEDVTQNLRDDINGPMFDRGDYRFISIGIDWG